MKRIFVKTKNVRTFVALAEKLLPETFAAIDATESKGTIHKNAANRRKAVAASKLASMKK